MMNSNSTKLLEIEVFSMILKIMFQSKKKLDKTKINKFYFLNQINLEILKN